MIVDSLKLFGVIWKDEISLWEALGLWVKVNELLIGIADVYPQGNEY
jgi:hypothetical protein